MSSERSFANASLESGVSLKNTKNDWNIIEQKINSRDKIVLDLLHNTASGNSIKIESENVVMGDELYTQFRNKCNSYGINFIPTNTQYNNFYEYKYIENNKTENKIIKKKKVIKKAESIRI